MQVQTAAAASAKAEAEAARAAAEEERRQLREAQRALAAREDEAAARERAAAFAEAAAAAKLGGLDRRERSLAAQEVALPVDPAPCPPLLRWVEFGDQRGVQLREGRASVPSRPCCERGERQSLPHCSDFALPLPKPACNNASNKA